MGDGAAESAPSGILNMNSFTVTVPTVSSGVVQEFQLSSSTSGTSTEEEEVVGPSEPPVTRTSVSSPDISTFTEASAVTSNQELNMLRK